MKRLFIIIGILLAICCLGVVMLRSYIRNQDFGSRTRTYETLEKAIEEGVIRLGWLPGFLPRSAYNIREKRNSGENTVIACFSFDPSDDLHSMLSEAKEVPMTNTKGIRPSRIGKREVWFPDAIMDGEFGRLTPPGFRLYKIERRERVGTFEVMATWHLALNRKAGVCYLWFSETGL